MTEITDTVLALREAFDRSFATRAQTTLDILEDLLMIRVGGAPYAIRLRDIGGIVTKRPIVSVPAMAQHFLGLAGVRGDVVPVYGLGSILGQPEESDGATWLVLCGDAPRVALAFRDFDGYVRLPVSNIHSDDETRSARPYVSEVVRTAEQVSAVISVPRIVADLRKHSQTRQER